MNKDGFKKYLADIVLVAVFVAHMVTREWPFGGGLQTTIDVLLVIAIIMTLIRYLIQKPSESN